MERARTATPRETRISIRVDEARKATIVRAAKLQKTTLSDFILEQAYTKARELVDEDLTLRLSRKDFRKFCELLDRPPRASVRKMNALLSSKTVLD